MIEANGRLKLKLTCSVKCASMGERDRSANTVEREGFRSQ